MKRLRWIVHAGGLWFRLGNKWRGLFLTWPMFRMPIIAGGSEALLAQGTYLMMGDGASPEVFTEIAEVTGMGPGPNETSEDVDVTHLRSPQNRREFKAGFVDGGEFPFRIQYNRTAHATHATLATKLGAADPTNWRLVFNDGTSEDFAATIRSFGLEPIEVGGKIERTVVLKISGPVDYSGAGSPA